MRRIRDERGSMPMAMLIITVGMALSAALTPIVLRQFTLTRSLITRNTELNAAQTGMEVMMARVRAASDAKLNGLLEDLPDCTLSGDAGVDGTGESLTYQVTIAYRDQDANPLPCPLSDVPTTAIVTSVGGGSAGTRTLTATYVFSTSNTNIPGGAIQIATSSAGNLCFDSGGTKVPAAGTRVTMQICNGNSRQQFGYTSDLYLKLVNSETSTAGFGMCLDAGATHSSGNYLAFQPCPATRTARYQWSLDGSSVFHSTNPTNSGIESTCATVQTNGLVGSFVTLGACGANNTLNVFRSETGVGAGMAGDATAQLVNYAQFSRCFDVTGQDPNAKYMIAWFCKQSPNGVVDWNQQWVHPAPSPPDISATDNIVVTKSGTQYCLKSPGTATLTSYPVVVQCTAANRPTKELQWTVFHDTGAYATSYRIQDYAGNCLQPTDPKATPKDVHTDGTSKIIMQPCNSTELQKWNAPANTGQPTPLTDLTEK